MDEYDMDREIATHVPPRFPAIPDDLVAAAKQPDDPAARDEIARRLFGTWPLPAEGQPDAEEVVLDGYLGRYIRDELLRDTFGDAAAAAAVRLAASEYESRLLGKFKRDRSTFADWVRLTVQDLTIQETIDRYQQAEALAELARAQQAGQPVPAGYEGITVTAEQAADAIRLGEELRQAVQHLVWQRYFHADPETHAAGELRLAPAVGWIKDIFDQAHRSLRPEDGDALAQEFFLGKILERNILRQFQPKLRSSFNQWIKISLQNYARDKLDQAAMPPVVSLDDALRAGLAAEEQADGEPLAGLPPADYGTEAVADPTAAGAAGETEPTPVLAVAAEAVPAESLEHLLGVALPGILADELQQSLLKLFFGLPPNETDLMRLARERVTRWAAVLSLQAVGVARPDPGADLAVPELAAAFARLREAAAVAGVALPEAGKPAGLADTEAAALERWAYAALAAPADKEPALPKSLHGQPAAQALPGVVAKMQRVLMAVEHLPAADGGPSVVAATAAAIGQWLEEARATAGVEQQEFQTRALRTINQRQTKLRQLEARQRQLEPGSAAWEEAAATINEVRRALANKSAELRKRTFGPSDADLARLLGIEPGSVAGLKGRMLRNLREFLDADRLAEQRRKLAAPLRRRAADWIVTAYEARLEALAAWHALPQHEGPKRRLAEVSEPGAFDDEVAERYRALWHAAQRRDASPALRERWLRLRGEILGREALLDEGVPAERVLAYEEEALRLLTAVAALRQLGAARW